MSFRNLYLRLAIEMTKYIEMGTFFQKRDNTITRIIFIPFYLLSYTAEQWCRFEMKNRQQHSNNCVQRVVRRKRLHKRVFIELTVHRAQQSRRFGIHAHKSYHFISQHHHNDFCIAQSHTI